MTDVSNALDTALLTGDGKQLVAEPDQHLEALERGRHQRDLAEVDVGLGDQPGLGDEPDRCAGGQLRDAQRTAGVEDPHTGGEHNTRGFQRLDEKVGYLLLE